MPDWKTRLREEHLQLAERIGRLDAFLMSAFADQLPPGGLDLLRRQRDAMGAYYAILTERLDRFG